MCQVCGLPPGSSSHASDYLRTPAATSHVPGSSCFASVGLELFHLASMWQALVIGHVRIPHIARTPQGTARAHMSGDYIHVLTIALDFSPRRFIAKQGVRKLASG